MHYSIKHATTTEDLAQIAELFTEYTESLGVDLTFQNFKVELESLPGKYVAPGGCLLLASSDDSVPVPLGCVALRPLGDGFCEMKRLYVRTNARGLKLGLALMNEAEREAIAAGYIGVRLDTLSTLVAALSMYRSHGFAEIESYYETPLENTVFFEKRFDRD
ncbi:unnamed protein product [Kuraishia capsulata CBS 1993]|uniref:N-acetyltransferase domain-containing protein n=1 Tax=Kuraishia capsulata CBS 1993 TaxID=1382522 RepID=W6MSH1_9ASCO|nr:uncharacterized protein KUCA_T00000706001 [Kuraishia capsulata CBS 1993]CDK24740.1 unnamed protein product [Kuraishia capsulata CBS 1993]